MQLSEAVDGHLLFKAARASPRATQTDRYCLSGFLDWLDDDVEVQAVTPDHIRDYLAVKREEGCSPHYSLRIHAAISALYGWLRDEEVGLARSNPARAVKLGRCQRRCRRPSTASR
jgi:site-specific recombinase XerD